MGERLVFIHSRVDSGQLDQTSQAQQLRQILAPVILWWVELWWVEVCQAPPVPCSLQNGPARPALAFLFSVSDDGFADQITSRRAGEEGRNLKQCFSGRLSRNASRGRLSRTSWCEQSSATGDKGSGGHGSKPARGQQQEEDSPENPGNGDKRTRRARQLLHLRANGPHDRPQSEERRRRGARDGRYSSTRKNGEGSCHCRAFTFSR